MLKDLFNKANGQGGYPKDFADQIEHMHNLVKVVARLKEGSAAHREQKGKVSALLDNWHKRIASAQPRKLDDR